MTRVQFEKVTSVMNFPQQPLVFYSFDVLYWAPFDRKSRSLWVQYASKYTRVGGRELSNRKAIDGPLSLCLPGDPFATVDYFRFLVIPYLRFLYGQLDEESIFVQLENLGFPLQKADLFTLFAKY